jgi:hypothetical protein
LDDEYRAGKLCMTDTDADSAIAPRLPRQIELNDLRSVIFWSRRFGVTPAQLLHAVKQVGSDAIELARYLGEPRAE